MNIHNRMDYNKWPTSDSSKQLRTIVGGSWTKREAIKKKPRLLNPKGTKYSSMKIYTRDILKQSLITSIPEITISKSWTKKAIKIVVFILCLIGFIYQTLDFLWLYLSYPTVVNVLVSNPFKVIQPALTLCNRNRERRSLVCSAEDNECFNIPDELICETYPRYCPLNKTSYKMIPFVNSFLQNYWIWENQDILSHTDFIIGSCFKVIEGEKIKCKKPYRRIPAVTSNGEPNFCYIVESLWENPDEDLERYPNTFYFELELNTEPEEYIIYSKPILIQVAVHDRRRIVNPYREGFSLKGGGQYEAKVTMTEKRLLPAPFDTNCTDYLEMWKKNNGTGPVNDLMCIEYCKLNALIKQGKCIDSNVAYPNTEELCKREAVSVTSDIIGNCTKSCNVPCWDYSYEVKYEEINNYEHICKNISGIDEIDKSNRSERFRINGNNEWCKSSKIKLVIYFKQLRLTKFQYQPKFESVEMFSYIGGYMGMWLGLSLVSLFDFFETVFLIMYFPIGRWRWKMTGQKTKSSYVNAGRNIYHSKNY